VGIILFEMLTGKPPFAAETAMDTLSMHLTAPLPKLSDHGAFPGSLQRIINRAMAKKPDDRFADAQAFLAAVEAVDLRENSEITIVIPKLVPDAARLAQWKSGIRQFLWSTRRRQGLTILAAIAVAAIVIFSVVRLSGDDAAGRKNPTPDRVATPQKPDRPVTAAQRELDTLLETAQTALTDRRYDDASTAARQALNLDKDNAAAMVALGHALFATSKQIGAVYQYQGAIEIDAAQATDERLRSNLMDALLYDETRNRAALLLARYGTEADLTRLADICNSKLTNGEVRRAVRMALEKTGHMDRIDWFETLTADFHEMKGCKERNLLIGQMLEKGDPRFIPFLEEFRPRAKKQANGVTTTENACIKASVDYAIRRLSAPPAIPAAQKP